MLYCVIKFDKILFCNIVVGIDRNNQPRNENLECSCFPVNA